MAAACATDIDGGPGIQSRAAALVPTGRHVCSRHSVCNPHRVTPARLARAERQGAAPVHLFFFDLPVAPIELDPGLAKPLRAWHARIANAGYALIGLHAAAALVHHYVLRDNALARVLPLLRQRLPIAKRD